MAEHVHTTYSCDRCKADLGDKRPWRDMRGEINADFGYLECPGPSFKWKDLCDECDCEVKAFFLPKDMHPAETERQLARAWFTEVLAYANKDMADYIMVRAKRMIGGWRP